MPSKEDVRKIALSLDGVTEVDHWGRPSYRTTKRIFAVMRPDGLYLNLPEERKEFLFEAAPDVFVKYMWGKTANVIVQIAKVSQKELKALIEEAYTHNLPPPPKAKKTKSVKDRFCCACEKAAAANAIPQTDMNSPAHTMNICHPQGSAARFRAFESTSARLLRGSGNARFRRALNCGRVAQTRSIGGTNGS